MRYKDSRPFVERRFSGFAPFLRRRTLSELIVIVMAYEPDLSSGEIAEICEMSVESVIR